MSAAMTGKSVIVTGSGSGIGRAAAMRFAAEGAHVTVVDRDAKAGQETVRSLTEAGARAFLFAGDVAKADDVRAMLEGAVSRFDGIDVIVNNAGVQYAGDVVDCAEDEWDYMMAVNARSCFLAAKYGVPYLRARGGGAIVNNASLAAVKAAPGLGAYSASKGAILAFSRTLAAEVAKDNIRVNVVCPGWTDTTFNGPSIEHMGGTAGLERFVHEHVPLRRLGAPSEIAAAMVYLASEDASYMTGQALIVDGGIN